MVFMTYKTLMDYNITGNSDQILVYVANNVPIFTPILLLAFFTIICMSTYFGAKKFYGNSDIWSSTMVAGFLTLILAMFLTTTQGIISLSILSSLLALFIVFAIIYFLAGRE